MQIAPAPLFRDPIFDGPTDPTICYNPHEKSWWIVYTSRRANVPCHNVSWVHGTALGVASSSDNGKTWLYRGTLNLEPIEPGCNTFWAPEILWVDDCCHMFVSYVTGVPDTWAGDRRILHYTSKDLWNWQYENTVDLPSNRVIDACVHKIPDGWRLWYKDENDNNSTHYADSPDLFTWTEKGAAVTDQPQEGPNVFTLGGRHWMIADVWDGQAVYRSDDFTNWVRLPGTIMAGKGTRTEDTQRAHHADVLVVDDHAYIFYFVHPNQDAYGYDSGLGSYAVRRSSLQVACLHVEADRLVACRDEPFHFFLPTE